MPDSLLAAVLGFTFLYFVCVVTLTFVRAQRYDNAILRHRALGTAGIWKYITTVTRQRLELKKN